MDTPAARLEKKFKRKHWLTESDIGKTEKAALQRLLKEGRVVRVRAYYLAGYEPTLQSESERILEKLLSRATLFRRTALRSCYPESQPFFRSALTKLLAEKRVLSLGVSGTDREYFIHRDHLVKMLDSSGPRPSKSAETYEDGDNRKKLASSWSTSSPIGVNDCWGLGRAKNSGRPNSDFSHGIDRAGFEPSRALVAQPSSWTRP
jgi:hypothetical protein